MLASTTEMLVGTVAHALRSEVGMNHPVISGELPIGGHRFEGLLPPMVENPAFSIRRRTSRLVALDEYLRDGIMTEAQLEKTRGAVTSRQNIVISAGTGSGKTTLTSAVIGEIVDSAPDDGLVILEDTEEIRCDGKNVVALHTSEAVDMTRLLKSTM